MYYLDCACQVQVDALANGRPEVQLISEEAARKGFEQFEHSPQPTLPRQWAALLRMLERKGIDYRA
jgi:hypothetical protein